VTTRLIHVSDLHCGAGHDEDVEGPLRALVEAVQPALIVATGDLTHRGKPEQHARAAALLRALGPPVLATPGNHDIPLLPPARFTHPWRAFERSWGETEPVHESEGLLVVGLNSVRPWRHQSGGLADDAVHRAAARLAAAKPGTLRVICLHHQLANAPWRTRKRPLARRKRVLAALAEAGAELILSGHVHQAGVAERREFAVLSGEPSLVVVSAPGLTRPRPHRLGEAQGAHVITADDQLIAVATHVVDGSGYTAVGERRFPRH
jgi:3',5'-cyclic AMP phosphodiesterase CpdA